MKTIQIVKEDLNGQAKDSQCDKHFCSTVECMTNTQILIT